MLHVREAGSGPAMLLIHGGSIDSESWGPMFGALAADRRVIAYDRRGTSASRDAGASADYAVHAADAAQILRERDAAPADVVGWSSGGLVALTLALDAPEVVRSLVLIEPPFDARKNVTPGFLAAYLRMQLLRRLGRQERATDAWAGYITSLRSGGSTWADDPNYPEERKRRYRANAETFAVELGASDAHLSDERLAGLAVPVTVLLGDQSPSWFQRCAKAAERRIPGAQLRTVPGMGHAISLTAPDAAVAAIREAAGTTAPQPMRTSIRAPDASSR